MGIKIEPGKYKNIAYAEYATWDAFSSHGVSPMLRSGLHYNVVVNSVRTPTESMALGQLVDALLLEENRLDDFFILPETYVSTDKKGNKEEKAWNMRSNTCRGIYKEMIDAGKTPIAASAIAAAREMVESVSLHPAAGDLLEDCETQICVVWDAQVLGDNGAPTGQVCRCKARLDAVKPGNVIDLKTTLNASPGAFSREIEKYKYHVQLAVYSEAYAALYSDGIVPATSIIAVENDRPYCCAVYQLGEDSIAAGKFLYHKAMQRYVEQNGNWLGYSQFAEPIDIPRYAIDRTLNEGVYNA